MRPLPVHNPPNPWSSTEVDYLGEPPEQGLVVYEDASRSILASNDSPDVGFDWSVNPYRGCTHACAYCYSRPTHEYLSFGAGTDFERRILVKTRAPALLREAFERKSWKGELVVFSGVTDCYQPLEASYRLTRACLEVCADYGNPVGIITKSPLIERDVDVLGRLAREAHVSVTISVPLWRDEVARAIEPGVTTPRRRVGIVRRLAEAGIPVGVNVAPWIPGLVEDDLAEILGAASEAGARWAGTVLLRLPGSVAPVFEERLRAALPLRADKVLARIREAHGGRLYDPRFGHRQSGDGPYAQAARALFEATTRRFGLSTGRADASEAPERATFHRPGDQLRLLF